MIFVRLSLVAASVSLFTSAALAASAASPTLSAQTCTNPSRGLTLLLPAIAGGQLGGELQITRLGKVLVSIAPGDVRNLKVADDARSFSFDGNDTKGTEITRVKTSRDSIDRLIVEVVIKDRGLIGFACPREASKKN